MHALADRMPHAELAWGEGSQIDFYDQPGQVAFAVRAAARHFRAHLSPLGIASRRVIDARPVALVTGGNRGIGGKSLASCSTAASL